MQTRRDQVQAQSYVLGRLTSALVMAEPEALENPHRRIVVGTVVGVLLAGLVVAGFTVYGFLRPGGDTAWRKPRTLIVEKDTGARYVLVAGALRPVLNYASAVLLLGGRPPMTSVSSASLRSVPRGLPLGIVGAPDTLPPAGGLTGTWWSVCAAAGATGGTVPALAVDRRPARPEDDDGALLVRGPDEQQYLVWHGRRLRLARPWVAPVLGLDGPAVDVPAAWLNQLLPGPDLDGLPVDGRGEPGPAIDGTASRIGQVYVTRVAGTPDRHYLLRRDGLSPLGATALALALGDPATATVYGTARVEPIPLTPGALSQLPHSTRPVLPDDVPAAQPALLPPPATGATWCVRRRGEIAAATLTADGPAAPMPSAATGTALGITRTAQTAAAVRMAAGVGGLVRLGRAEQANGGALFLVTDAGVKFPVPSADVAKALGYNATAAGLVAPALLDLLPTGSVLDPAEARR
ncbi:type VII secretion protein EccB [Virgisporangium aurantiacum]|uniref:Type VII secretion protein EccB n=1 Tax=Virgisporangium aurantiacum TaxID=175570 RepID=A0A8J4E5U0_9ACTN|nr:type VII secretion protein EccB [Virgisporangium aurantiacum]GIJ62443.1 type VII secretion protein EccB [Virgisporangium aurantiacum]